MALFKKKGGKPSKAVSGKATKAADKGAPSKQSKPSAPPDIYTLFLGLAALFFIVATLVLGLNYYWYQSADVVPLNWVR